MGIHFPKDPCLANNIVIPIQHEVCYRYCRRRCCLQRFGPGWGHQVCPTPEGVRGPGSQAGGDGIRRNWIIWNGKPWTNHWTEQVVASPVVRTILNTAQNPVYYSGYQGYTRPTYTTSYLVPTASATQYAAYY